MSLRFSKTRNVKSPKRANPTDAGMDMFIPEFDDGFKEAFKAKNNYQQAFIEDDIIHIPKGGRVCIPSGCHFNLDEGYALMANNKSGVATNTGLTFGAQLIDSDYQGEVHLSLLNPSQYMVKLEPGQKIIQFVYLPVRLDQPEEVPFDELYTEETSRGTGGFGSTGDK